MDQLSLGVMARSRKENERRLALHPLHIERIGADVRQRMHKTDKRSDRAPDQDITGRRYRPRRLDITPASQRGRC
ncbi:MAG TPA: hypothetical protein VIV12_20940, partial [Streptosporangiaceae bacterium]